MWWNVMWSANSYTQPLSIILNIMRKWTRPVMKYIRSGMKWMEIYTENGSWYYTPYSFTLNDGTDNTNHRSLSCHSRLWNEPHASHNIRFNIKNMFCQCRNHFSNVKITPLARSSPFRKRFKYLAHIFHILPTLAFHIQWHFNLEFIINWLAQMRKWKKLALISFNCGSKWKYVLSHQTYQLICHFSGIYADYILYKLYTCWVIIVTFRVY